MSQTMTSFATLLVPLEHVQWIGSCTKLVSQYNGEVIEYWTIFNENSFKSKVKTTREFGYNFGIVQKPLMNRI
jgi:hypothetical protein